MEKLEQTSDIFIKHVIVKNTQMYLIFSALVALFIYTALSDDKSSLLTFWLACIETNTLALAIFHMMAKRRGSESLKDVLFKGGIIVNGLLWGAFSGIFLSMINPDSQVLIIMSLLAVAALGVPLMSSDSKLVLIFSSVVLLPPAIFFFSELTPTSIGKGLVIASLVPIIIRVVNIAHDFQKKSDALRLKHQDLIEQLNIAVEKSESTNVVLKKEIAEKKKTEDALIKAKDLAEDAVRAKGEFLATMSHEIRTPMNGVLGMTELLKGTNLTAKQERFTSTIHKSGSALLTIINDILDFSKIEAGKLEINETVFDLRLLIEDLGNLFAEQAARKNISLSCLYPAEGHSMFSGDQERIRQISINLLGNALKFTEKGEVICRVELVEKDDEKFIVRFRVEDTGIGIPDEVQEKIFDSFSQADGSTTRKFGGTGLGLTICKMLTKLMKGKIGVKSKEGNGSIFWFAIPLGKEVSVKQNLTQTLQHDFSHYRALIADANPTSRKALEQQLDSWGLDYYSIDNGKKALQKIKDEAERGEPFNLVIIDNEIPGYDGITLAKKINNNDAISNTKIIMLSSVGNMEQTGQWLMAGVESYISKPIRQQELFDSVTKALENKVYKESSNKNSMGLDPEKTLKLMGHVLVAEDNIVNQELVREMLTQLGCTVEIVEHGRLAFELISECALDNFQQPFDMILMDCQMPEMDGFEATRRIRDWENTQSVLNRIPIVALTANAMEGDREKCLRSGMDDYMTKPFNLEQIGAILHRWLPIIGKENRSEVARLKEAKKQNISASIQQHSTQPQDEVNSFHHAEDSQLDPAAFVKIRRLQREGQENIVIKVTKLFLENSQKTILLLEQAISKGDLESLQHSAASLRSSSMTIGATSLVDLCSELLELGKLGNSGKAQSRLSILEFEYDEVCKALHHVIAQEQESSVA